MRELDHARIAIITPQSNDLKTELELFEVRGIHADPVIKMENGEKKFSYLVSIDTDEKKNDLVEVARYFRVKDIIISGKDRSSYRTSITDFDMVKENLGYLKGTQKREAEKEELYIYNPQTKDYYIFN